MGFKETPTNTHHFRGSESCPCFPVTTVRSHLAWSAPTPRPDLPDTSKCRQAYAVEARQLPRNHVSYSYKFVCISSCKYSSNDICTYLYDQRVDKLIILLHLKSKYVSAYATLPPQHRPKKMLSQVSTHLTQDCERSGRQPTLGQDALHSKKNEAHIPLLPSPHSAGPSHFPELSPVQVPRLGTGLWRVTPTCYGAKNLFEFRV